VRTALTGWAFANPAESLAWLGKEASPSIHRQFAGAAIRGLAATEPDLAISLLEGIPLERRKNYINEVMPTIIRSSGIQQAEQLMNDILTRATAAGTIKDPYIEGLFRQFAEGKLRRAFQAGDGLQAADWVGSLVGQPYVPTGIVRMTAENLAKTDPQQALKWLDTVSANANYPPNAPIGYETVANLWARKDGPGVVSQWLGANSNHPHYDTLVSQYVAVLGDTDRKAAGQWAASIHDPKVRETTEKKLATLPPKK